MSEKGRKRYHSEGNVDPRIFQGEGLINKNDRRKNKRDKRNENCSEWKKERENY